MTLYVISYGNGFLGSRVNMGTKNVVAKTAQEAKVKLHKAEGIKLGHMKIKAVERVIV